MSNETRLIDRLDEMLDELGIESGLIVAKDPDSDAIVLVKRGSTLWLWGATNGVQEMLRERWRREDKDSCA